MKKSCSVFASTKHAKQLICWQMEYFIASMAKWSADVKTSGKRAEYKSSMKMLSHQIQLPIAQHTQVARVVINFYSYFRLLKMCVKSLVAHNRFDSFNFIGVVGPTIMPNRMIESLSLFAHYNSIVCLLHCSWFDDRHLIWILCIRWTRHSIQIDPNRFTPKSTETWTEILTSTATTRGLSTKRPTIGRASKV